MTPGEPLVRWDWVGSHLGEIASRLGEHVVLAAIAVVIGFVLSFGLSLMIRRHPLLYSPVTWTSGVLYTIPSLALFALLIPVTGLTLLTAEIGLVSYTLLILVRNIVAGLRGAPADVREAAVAMGYTDRELLLGVEIPLAVPVIMAGIRVATVTTIGLTTVTALIGQGGFGYLILLGIQTFFSTPLIVGAVGSVLLAVIADSAIVALQRLLVPWERRR
jgi:osmoprotectant transport system permease protein